MDTHTEELIDRFVGNEMEPDERRDFCRRLEADEELKRQVELRALAADALTREAEKAAWQALKGGQPQKRRGTRLWTAAAVVAAVVMGVVLFIGNSYRYTTAELFGRFYEQPVVEPARGGSEIPEILAIAGRYLMQERAQDALALLTPEVLDSEYGEEAEWMLLCAYLQANRRKEAVQTAEKIGRKGGPYAEKAKEIERGLKEKRW